MIVKCYEIFGSPRDPAPQAPAQILTDIGVMSDKEPR